MAVPEVIPIAYEPNQRSGAVGRYADGQFLASVTYAFPQGFRPDDGWEEQKRLYTVLHTFDPAGRYRDSEIWCAGTWAQQQSAPDGDGSVLSQARIHLAKLLRALPAAATPTSRSGPSNAPWTASCSASWSRRTRRAAGRSCTRTGTVSARRGTARTTADPDPGHTGRCRTDR